MSMFSEMKQQYAKGGYLTRLLYINCCVFLILKLALLICVLFELPTTWVSYLELPSNVRTLLHTPWTIFTYMFVHVDFLHALFNLLTLYWFGRIFLECFNQKQLVGVYIWGGLAGALVYILSMNFIPYFENVKDSGYLIGASASIMAIIFAAVVYSPNRYIRLALIGDVRLKYLGLAILVLDVLGFAASNLGGTMAHIGGVLFGVIYAWLYAKKNVDLSAPITSVINFFSNISFKRKQKSAKAKYTQKPKTDEEWNMRNNNADERINSILDKIKKYGYSSLTEEEKRDIFDISHKK